MIDLSCASCRENLAVNDELAGTNVTCPGCRKSLVVPQPSTLAPRVSAQALKESVSCAEGETGLGGTSGEVTGTWAGAAPKRESWDFLAPPQQPDELGRLGPFRVLQVLGAGGMGVVFKADDPELNRPVALKAMLPALAASESARKRFVREAQAAAAVVHDHIVRIFQVGEDRGVPFLAMQFLEGESLADRLQREPRLTATDILRIGRETAQGLAAAHQCGLIHRDIKPANLWLEARDERREARGEIGPTDESPLAPHPSPLYPPPSSSAPRVKILDFGLARAAADDAHLTQSGAIVGTPAYMAPEQAAGEKVDLRCDLFSLGCVLYRLVTATMPFKGKDAISTLVAIATEDPIPPCEICPQVSPELSELVMQLLAKKPAERPDSAQAVVAALRAIEAGTPQPASARRIVRPLRRKQRRRVPWRLGFMILAVGLVGLLVTLLIWSDGRFATWYGLTFAKDGMTGSNDDKPPPKEKPKEMPAPQPPDIKIHQVGKNGLALEGILLPTDPKLVAMKKGDDVRQLPAKEFQVRLSAGKKYRIAMESDVLDSYLSVRDKSGHQVAWDDDSGDEQENALILLDVFKDGVFTIQAAAFSGFGEFTLKVKENGAAHVSDVGAKLSLAGSLTAVDSIAYSVRLRAGQTYVIDMLSPDVTKLKPMLHLLAEDGRWLAENGGSGKSPHARIRFMAWETGIYRIVAGDFDTGTGPFTLTVRPDPAAATWRDADCWIVNDTELCQTDRRLGHWMLFGDLSWTDYDFEVEAQTIAGTELDIAIRVAGPDKLVYVALGGSANTKHALVSMQPGKPQVVDTLKSVDGQTQAERWYRVRVEARGNDFKVFLDGKPLLTSVGAGLSPHGCIGLGTVNATARFRNPKVTTPEGKVLLDRWPADVPRTQQPKAGARRAPRPWIPRVGGLDAPCVHASFPCTANRARPLGGGPEILCRIVEDRQLRRRHLA